MDSSCRPAQGRKSKQPSAAPGADPTNWPWMRLEDPGSCWWVLGLPGGLCPLLARALGKSVQQS